MPVSPSSPHPSPPPLTHSLFLPHHPFLPHPNPPTLFTIFPHPSPLLLHPSLPALISLNHYITPSSPNLSLHPFFLPSIPPHPSPSLFTPFLHHPLPTSLPSLVTLSPSSSHHLPFLPHPLPSSPPPSLQPSLLTSPSLYTLNLPPLSPLHVPSSPSAGR